MTINCCNVTLRKWDNSVLWCQCLRPYYSVMKVKKYELHTAVATSHRFGGFGHAYDFYK